VRWLPAIFSQSDRLSTVILPELPSIHVGIMHEAGCRGNKLRRLNAEPWQLTQDWTIASEKPS
jgi:hypothetical protein